MPPFCESPTRDARPERSNATAHFQCSSWPQSGHADSAGMINTLPYVSKAMKIKGVTTSFALGACLHAAQGFVPPAPAPHRPSSHIHSARRSGGHSSVSLSPDIRFRESATRQWWSSAGGVVDVPASVTFPVPTPTMLQNVFSQRGGGGEIRSEGGRVRNRIRGAVRRQSHTKLSAFEVATLHRIRDVQKSTAVINMQRRLTVRMGRAPTQAEWASALGLSETTLMQVLERGQLSRAKLVKSMGGMVQVALRKYRRVLTPSEMEDLTDEAYLGILQAALRYEPAKGKFTTYAFFYINKRACETAGSYSRIAMSGRSDSDALRSLRRAENDLAQGSASGPTPADVAEKLDWPLTRVLDVQRRSRPVVSAERALYDNVRAVDLLEDTSVEMPGADLSSRELESAVMEAMSRLSTEERTLLAYRLGLVDGRQRSWEELLHILPGCTMQYLRKVELRARSRLMRELVGCSKVEGSVLLPFSNARDREAPVLA